MSTETTKLKIKKPSGNETVTRAAFNENYDIIDTNAAAQVDFDSHKSAKPIDHPDSSVETAKIKDAAVTAVKLADSSVETAKIKDAAVTNAKLADAKVSKAGDTMTGTLEISSADPVYAWHDTDGPVDKRKMTAVLRSERLYFTMRKDGGTAVTDPLTLIFDGGIFVSGNSSIQGHWLPHDDNARDCGNASYRWKLVRGVTITSGDLGFEERDCPLCGQLFKDGEILVLMVKKVHDYGTLTIPIHERCKDIKRKLTFQVPEMVDEYILKGDGTVEKVRVEKINKKTVQAYKLKPGYEFDKVNGGFIKQEVMALKQGIEDIGGEYVQKATGRKINAKEALAIKENARGATKDEALAIKEEEREEVVYRTVVIST